MSKLSERHEREEKFYSVMKLREEVLALEARILVLEDCVIEEIYAESPGIEAEVDNGMNAKASAVEMAQSLNLDDAIRVVAKSGKNHVRGPNWYAEWDDLSISATFGAGTDSASVKIIAQGGMYDNLNNVEVYRAGDFGRRIEAFRYGPWVHKLIYHAGVLRQANEAKRKIDEAAKAIDEATNFKEVDF